MGAAAVGGAVTAASPAIGVFGGTFDPIHVAHLAVAEAARDALGLERVLFIPNRQPPHKPDQAVSPAADRLAMVRAAIAGNPAFETSTIEIDRDAPSYTADTLDALRAERLAAGESGDLALILSIEALAGLATWHEPARVLELAQLVVAPRDGYPDVDPAAIARLVPGADGPHRRAGRAADAPLGVGDPVARRGRTVVALPRAGCGRRVYRRPWALHRTPEDGSIVTEPALPGTVAAEPRVPSADGLPHRDTPAATTGDRAALDLARRIVELAEDKKAADIVLLELAPLTTLADYFVICSGGSERQLEAIADGIISALRDEKQKPIGREGTAASHWVLHRLRVGHRPHLHAPRTRLLRPREALV